MKVWLDDEPHKEARARLHPSPEWTHTRWPSETIALLQTGAVTHLSLDHDLGDQPAAVAEGRREVTGYEVIVWIEEQVKNNGFKPPQIWTHSQNGPGRDRIAAAIRQVEKYAADNSQSE